MSPAFPPVFVTAGGRCWRRRGITVCVKQHAFIRDFEMVAFKRRPRQPATRFRLFSALIVRAPGIVGWRELIEHVYGDRPDGGADRPVKVFQFYSCNERAAFARLGIGFATERGIGMQAHDLWAEARPAA